MNLEPTDEQLALGDTVRRYLATKAPVATHVRPLLDDPTGTTDEVWRGLADLGILGLLVPEEHGGAGQTMIEAGIVAEELGRALHPGPWLSSTVAAPRALARFGAADEAAKLLAGIAGGDRIATVAVLPETGQLRIDRNAEGAVLTGRLADVADAAAAGTLLLVTDDDLFIIPLSMTGSTVTAAPTIDATRKRFQVDLDQVPARRLARATEDANSAYVDDLLIAWAADALGAARALLDLTLAYAGVRHQFGRPIGSFQAVQHLCVDMHERVELARGSVLKALWAADHAAAPERHLAAVRCKAFSGHLAGVGDTAIQVLGGIGFTWEHDAHLYLKRLLTWSAFRGGPDRYLDELGAHVAQTYARRRGTGASIARRRGTGASIRS